MSVFRFFNEIIRKERNWTEASIEDPTPSLADFNMNRVVIPQNLLNQALNNLNEKHFCLIVGDANSGKTWLSYTVGKKLLEQSKEVMYIKIGDDFDATKAWNEIINDFKSEIFFIVEDCHTNPRECEKFLETILDENKKFKFLFNTRKRGVFLLRNSEIIDIFYNELVMKRQCMINTGKNIEHVKNIIIKFFEIKEYEFTFSEKELDFISRSWGTDLYLIWLRLVIWWKYQKEKKLIEIDETFICRYLWENTYEGVKLSNSYHREILLPLAVICQFTSINIEKEFLIKSQVDENLLDYFIREGIVRIFSYDRIGISENYSRIVLLSISHNNEYFRLNRENYTIQTFENYMESNPHNWYVFLRNLYVSRDKNAVLINKILISLMNNIIVWNNVKKNVIDLPLGRIHTIMDILLWISKKTKYWEDQKTTELQSIYFKRNYDNIQLRLKSSSANAMKRYLDSLSNMITLNIFLENFSIEDFKKIISLSSIYSIRMLFSTFEHWNLNEATRKLTDALITIPNTTLAKLIANHDSLYRLGGLIVKVRNVDDSKAIRLIANLSHVDLYELLSKKDLPAEERGLSKANVVSHFLSKNILFSAEYFTEINDDRLWLESVKSATRIVNNIDDRIWLDIIQTTSLIEGFWVLWNIYRHSKVKAESLVQKNAASLLLEKARLYPKGIISRIKRPLEKTLKKKEMDYYLPLLGLLHECNFNISQISLPEKDIKTIRERLQNYNKVGPKQYPKTTLFVLSLIALRATLSQDQYNENIKGYILGTEPMHHFVFFNKDPQIAELLTKLVKTHSL